MTRTEESIFAEALDQPSPDERAAFVIAACGENAGMRARVERLLKSHTGAGSFLTKPVAPTIAPLVLARPGTSIGRYKLLEQIGEGGMGTVWVAEQTEPVRRRVALKLIKPGMDTKQVLSRFEAERQALALMDHPNIARVFDGGMTDEGRPFFVMEYVKGLPLTQYCDDTQLTVADRLALFTQVCQAVQHAHQKGIIHRDLKPSNILVCLYDGQPVPKVIDFGLAKAMHQPLTEHTLYTAHGLMMGTPLYMSPEQAEFNNLDIDTRSDIYSLGVILYELLTGTTPLEKRQFKDAAWQEMVRLIKEEEPPRPSIRLSGSGSLPMLAAQRQLDPTKLTKTVRGELDWIVMKALEKDRNRRYETANGLARDVQRYLADESVEACPPSTSYRLRKFTRRNMRALTSAALVGVMLLVVVGAVAGSLGWLARDRDARHAKLAGQLELILDEVKQQEAEQKWPAALAAARRAETLLAGGGGDAHLVRQVNEVLADLKLVERLEAIRMEQSVNQDDGFERVELAYAAAFREIGVDLDGITADEAARRLRLRPAVAPVVGAILDEWTAWRCLSGKAEGGRALSAVAGRLDDDPWRQQVRGVVAQIDTNIFADEGHGFGNMDPKAVAALERLAASPDVVRQPPATLYHLGMMLTVGGAKPEVGATLLRKAHAQYPGDFWINNALAESLGMMGANYLDESLGYYRAALALRPDVGWTWYKIGAIQQVRHNKLDEANACYRKALELTPMNAWIHNNVGQRLQAQQKLGEAVAHYHKAIELNPKFTLPHSNLGGLLRAEKRFDEAAAAYRKAIEIDPKGESGHYGLGMGLQEQNRVDEAVATLTRAIELCPKGANLRWALGRALHKQKKLDDAVACFHKAVELKPKLAMGHWGLGFVLLDQKKADEALGFFQTAVTLDPNHAYTQYGFGLALMETKQMDDALIAFRKAVEIDPTQGEAHINVGVLLLDQGKVDEAITSFRKAIEQRPKNLTAHNRLGIALADRGQVAEGIAYFRKAVELNPNLSWAHINLAWYLATAADPKLRDPQAAVVHAQMALDLDDNAPKHWNKLGVALWRAGNAKAAVETLEMADKKWDGKIHQYRFFLAMAYWQLGEKDKARQAYDQGVQWMDQLQANNEEQRRFRAEAAELLAIAQPVVTTPH